MKAILRVKKIASSNLGSVDAHNRRKMPVPNSDGSRSFLSLINRSSDSLVDLVKNRLSSVGITKLRKNSPPAVEIMLTASPEYFRKDANGKPDHYFTKEWIHATKDFLIEKYGDNLVDAIVHLDELTPHIHAIVVPAVKKERRVQRTREDIELNRHRTTNRYGLAARDMFSKFCLIDLQSEYANAVSHLGLERGQQKSKATHTQIKTWYHQKLTSPGKQSMEVSHDLSL